MRSQPAAWAASLLAGLLGWIAGPSLAALLPAASRAPPLAFALSRGLAWGLAGATRALLAPGHPNLQAADAPERNPCPPATRSWPP